MDEELKQKIFVPVIAGGLTFTFTTMGMYLMGFPYWQSILCAFGIGGLAAGIGFGVVYMMQRNS